MTPEENPQEDHQPTKEEWEEYEQSQKQPVDESFTAEKRPLKDQPMTEPGTPTI